MVLAVGHFLCALCDGAQEQSGEEGCCGVLPWGRDAGGCFNTALYLIDLLVQDEHTYAHFSWSVLAGCYSQIS